MKIHQFGVKLQSPGQRECNWTVGCPFLTETSKCSEEKIAFRYPVSEFLNYKKFQKP